MNKDTNSPDLSIVIVCSKKDFILNCLESVKKASGRLNVEIILIDNASSDDAGRFVKKTFPDVVVVRRKENGGYGENNNLGIKRAKGKYVLLLNDDTKILGKHMLSEMVLWMEDHPEVGVSSCALLNADEKTYQGTGGAFPTLLRVFAWMFFIDDLPLLDKIIKPYHPMHGASPLYKNEDYFKKAHEQDWLTGAFFLMRKEALDEAGLFDGDYFLYVEEVDLCYRFRANGWKLWYLPAWKIVHFGSATIGNEKALLFELQNIKLFYKKHYARWKTPLLDMLLKGGILLRVFLFLILKGKDVSKIYVKAFNTI